MRFDGDLSMLLKVRVLAKFFGLTVFSIAMFVPPVPGTAAELRTDNPSSQAANRPGTRPDAKARRPASLRPDQSPEAANRPGTRPDAGRHLDAASDRVNR